MAESGSNGPRPDARRPDPLPPHQERGQIQTAVALHSALKKDAQWYVVDIRWWKQWADFVEFEDNDDDTKVVTSGRPRPGPIDNAPLLEQGRLRKGIVEEQDYVILPRTAWRLLHAWYGGGPKIPRAVYAFGEAPHIELRICLYPAMLEICLASAAGTPEPALSKVVLFPANLPVRELGTDLAFMVYSAPHRIRLWLQRENQWCPLADPNKTLEECGILADAPADKNRVMIESQSSNGHWPCDGPAPAPAAESAAGTELAVISSSQPTDTGDTSSSRTGWFGGLWSTQRESVGVAGTPPGKGLTGLQNLGNTCFMNSALQCLSQTAGLTQYFLNDEFKADVNVANPLGMKGQLAEEYSELLKLLWSNNYRSVNPSKFKAALGKFAPQFSGYQQQDSQELLAFLLDGLHEDLNRVKEKPYVAAVESDGRPDPIVSEEAWQAHLRRNRSIIVDLFQGQLKSTVTCPVCTRISITFDPFMYLSVPLPVRPDRVLSVTFLPLDVAKPRLKLAVRVPKEAKTSELRAAVGALVGVPAAQLQLADIYHGRVFAFLPDERDVSRILDRDETWAYEIVASTPSAPSPPPAADPAASSSPASTLASAPPSSSSSNAGSAPMDIEIRDVTPSAAPAASSTTSGSVVAVASGPIIVPVYNVDPDQKALGFPILLSYDKKPTGAQVYNDALARIMGSLVSRSLLPDQPLSALFELRPNKAGYYDGPCARCGSDTCKGCVLGPTDEQPLHLGERDAVIAKWSSAAMPAFDNSKAATGEVHASVREYEAEMKRVVPLAECFELYTRAERLSADDTWYCSSCREHRQATKKLDLWRLPKYLVIHLKRFQFSRSLRDKISMLVDFPLQGLDLAPFVPAQPPPLYDLFAVSNHSGDLGGGHYTASVLSPEGGWWLCNDSTVSRTEPSSVVCEEAYLLFYKLRDTPRPATPSPAPVPVSATATPMDH